MKIANLLRLVACLGVFCLRTSAGFVLANTERYVAIDIQDSEGGWVWREFYARDAGPVDVRWLEELSIADAYVQAKVDQTSTISSDEFSGSGGFSLLSLSASAGPSATFGGGVSEFDVSFNVASPQTYRLFGSINSALTVSGPDVNVIMLPTVQVALGRPDFTFLHSFAIIEEIGSLSFDVSGVLAPGQYRFGALAHGPSVTALDGSASGETCFNFTLQFVPEPFTYATIAGFGLLGFGGYRRLRRR